MYGTYIMIITSFFRALSYLYRGKLHINHNLKNFELQITMCIDELIQECEEIWTVSTTHTFGRA